MGVPMAMGFIIHIMGDGTAVMVRMQECDVLESVFGPGDDLADRYTWALEGEWEKLGEELVGPEKMAHFFADWRNQGSIVFGFLEAMHAGRAAVPPAPMKVRQELSDTFGVSHVVEDGWLLVTLRAPSQMKTAEQRERDDLEYQARLDPDLFRSLLAELLAYRKAASC